MGQRFTASHNNVVVCCQRILPVAFTNYRKEISPAYGSRVGICLQGRYGNPIFLCRNPQKFTSRGFLRKLIGPDTTGIASMAVYSVNSPSKTEEPSFVRANPFGIKNMAGNVAEFCYDIYY